MYLCPEPETLPAVVGYHLIWLATKNCGKGLFDFVVLESPWQHRILCETLRFLFKYVLSGSSIIYACMIPHIIWKIITILLSYDMLYSWIDTFYLPDLSRHFIVKHKSKNQRLHFNQREEMSPLFSWALIIPHTIFSH